MPSKTMRNIVTQIKKLRDSMEAILSEQQLEVRQAEFSYCFCSIQSHVSAHILPFSMKLIPQYVLLYIPFFLLQILFRDVRRKFKDSFAARLAEFGVSNDGGPQHGWVVRKRHAYFTGVLLKDEACFFLITLALKLLTRICLVHFFIRVAKFITGSIIFKFVLVFACILNWSNWG